MQYNEWKYLHQKKMIKPMNKGFPDGSDGKECACNAGDVGLIPGLGGSPGEGMATHFSILAWTDQGSLKLESGFQFRRI